MSFSKILEILQERNEKRIVLIKLGMFYIATGRNVVLLHDKYIEKLDKTGYF